MASDNPYAALLPETLDYGAFLIDPSPKRLHQLYEAGHLHGCWGKDAPYPYNRFAEWQAKEAGGTVLEDAPIYGQIKAATDVLAADDQDLVCSHHHWLKLDPHKAGKGNQLTGDCVSWGTRGAIDTIRAWQIIRGAWSHYVLRGATCGYYAGRRHNGEGAVSSWISAYALEIGTILEQVYEAGGKTYDFRDYATYVKWGMANGKTGVPKALSEQTKMHRPGGWHLIKSTEAARKLLVAGGGIHVGSQLAVENVGNPISRRKGTWAHDMHWCGFDNTRTDFPYCVWFVDQSWGGGWNRVTNIPDRWKPWLEGMFAISDADFQWAIDRGECCGFVPGRFYPGTDYDVL